MNVFSVNSCVESFFLSSSVCQEIVPKERRLSNCGTQKIKICSVVLKNCRGRKKSFMLNNKTNPLEHEHVRVCTRARTHTHTRTNHKETSILPSHQRSLQGSILFYKSLTTKSYFQ